MKMNEKFVADFSNYIDERIKDILKEYVGEDKYDLIIENQKLRKICEFLIREAYPDQYGTFQIMGMRFRINDDKDGAK